MSKPPKPEGAVPQKPQHHKKIFSRMPKEALLEDSPFVSPLDERSATQPMGARQRENPNQLKQSQDENKQKEAKQASNNSRPVKVTFIGGVGEIGKNMTAIEYGEDIIVIDAGLAFPGEDLPGVDLVVPDITYLENHKSKIRGVILTHGHEDHIGGLPYFLSEINVPVYGSAMTLALVEYKLQEHQKIKAKLVVVKPRNVLKLGCFSIEFINVSHSLAGSLALCITTPHGNILHTGDFKIDYSPIDGKITDLARFGELGKRGINLLLCESTNVNRKGFSMSESAVGRTLETLFMKYKEERLFVATFASNIHRIQQVLTLAEKYGRRICFIGRSMVNVSEAASKIGELKFNKENLIDVEKLDKFDPKEVVILSTGSQGEPNSAMFRLAAGEFNKIKVGEGDTVIFSASPIPGNEKRVYNVINLLFKKGANVVYDELAEVHASGHAYQEELKTIHALCKPKFFMPIHGEYRHLKVHKEVAIDMGMQPRDIILPDLGMQVAMTDRVIHTVGFVQSGQRLVDGTGIGDMDSGVLRERRQLSEEGICIAHLNAEFIAGDRSVEPLLICRGFVYDDEMEDFLEDARETMRNAIASGDFKSLNPNEMRENIRRVLSSFIFKRTKRRPMIICILS